MRVSGFLWLFLMGGLLLPGRPLWAALYLLGGAYLLARASLRRAAGQTVVERRLSDRRIFPGESVTVTVRFHNPTGIPLPWLEFTESRPPELEAGPLQQVLALGGGQTAEVPYTLRAVKRGEYEVGPLRAVCGDPFGFMRLAVELPGTDRFTVYPRVVPLPELGLPARLPMGDLAARRRLFEDPTRMTGVRGYSPGDPLKRIHWNATARTGELAVKQYRHAMLLPACVMLNLDREAYESRTFWSESELAVTAAASLCRYLVEQKQQVALVAVGTDPDESESRVVRLPLRQGRAAVMEALEVLARVQAASGGPPFARVVAKEARRLPWGTLLCLITPRETPELAATAARLGQNGQQVLLFVTGAGERGGVRPGYRVLPLTERSGGQVVVG